MASDSCFFENLITRICQPVSKAAHDEYQRQIIFQRNKGILPIAIGVIPVYTLFVVFSTNIPSSFHAFNYILMICEISLWMMCCRDRIGLFNWFFFISMTLYSPVIFIKYFKNSVTFAYVAVLTTPSVMLQMTGSKTICWLSGLTQLTILNTVLNNTIRNLLACVQDPSVVDVLISAGNFGALLNMGMMIGVNNKLIQAYREISRANERKSQQQKAFFLSLSHELRNPLNSLLGNMQLAVLEPSLKEVKNLLNNANICGQMLLHLVNNILDSAKMEISSLEVNCIPNHMKEVIESVWSICSEMIKKKKLQGLLKVSKNMPRCLNLDLYRLIQIMLNLVGNAVKFTETGTINVEMQWIEEKDLEENQNLDTEPFSDDGVFEKDEKVALLTWERWETRDHYLLGVDKRLFNNKEEYLFNDKKQRGILRISVRDTGCGMTQEAIGKLFQMFGQVHQDPCKRKIGTGLGLFITKELCKKMDGDIRVYSKVGQGTVFILDLPMSS